MSDGRQPPGLRKASDELGVGHGTAMGVESELSEVKTEAVCCLLETVESNLMIPNSYIR